MKALAIMAVILLVTKKAAEFVVAVFLTLLFGYGIYALVREMPDLIRRKTFRSAA